MYCMEVYHTARATVEPPPGRLHLEGQPRHCAAPFLAESCNRPPRDRSCPHRPRHRVGRSEWNLAHNTGLSDSYDNERCSARPVHSTRRRETTLATAYARVDPAPEEPRSLSNE